MEYNTQQPRLRLAEYGRNVQNMVQHCLGIEDRQERTLCAYAIVGVMRRLTPQQANTPEKEQKLWDQLNIMAEGKLDIDFPVEVLPVDQLHPAPKPVPYTAGRVRMRCYGKNIEKMVEAVADLEDGEDKEILVARIARQMKRLALAHNPQGADNARVLRDLALFSGGRIELDPETFPMRDFNDVPAPVPSQNRNRNNKWKKRKR